MNTFQFTKRLQGVVTQVNVELCSFTIQNDELFMSVIYAPLSKIYLPAIGEKLTMLNLHRDRDIQEFVDYYLDGGSNIYSNSPEQGVHTKDIKFSQLVHAHEWSILELRKYLINYFKRPIKLQSIVAGTEFEACVKLLEYLLESGVYKHDLIITSPVTCHYIKYKYEYEKGPYYSQGYHHSRPNEFLLGFLFINAYSFIELTDGESSVYLKVRSTDGGNLLPYINRVVVIKKFIVFTEIYKGGDNIEYVCCDVADFDVINLSMLEDRRVQHYFYLSKPKLLVYKEELVVRVLNLPAPNSTAEKRVENWMKVDMCRNGQWSVVYLCFELPLLSTLPLVDIGSAYSIFVTGQMVPYSDPEIKRIAKLLSSYKLIGAVFVKTSLPDEAVLSNIEVLTLDKLAEAMARCNRSTYVNFEAVITRKIFCPADESSRTVRQINSPMFGTSGVKRHILRFECMARNLKVTMYLNNWERKQAPIGVSPQLRVIVRHAELTKNYLRSNALTSFQVIGYENHIIYNTANLNPENPTIFYTDLGEGYEIPVGTMVRACPNNVKIRSFRMEYENNQLKLTTTLTTTDTRGCAYVICTDIEFFKKLFSLTHEEYYNWLEVFKPMKFFSIYEEDKQRMESDLIPVYDYMLKSIKRKLKKGIKSIDVLCRRLEPKALTDNKGLPLWFTCQILSVET